MSRRGLATTGAEASAAVPSILAPPRVSAFRVPLGMVLDLIMLAEVGLVVLAATLAKVVYIVLVLDSNQALSTLLFESLEPRLLLAADPLGITAGYAFNETGGTTTVDASGHGITGTLTNGPTFAAGKYGNAVALDGVNDFVNLGNPAALQLTGSMTVSAWIYSTSYPGDDASIVSKRTSGGVGFQLDTTVDTGRRTIGFKLTSSSGGLMARYGNTTLAANTWYYVTGVYNASTRTMDVYLNGVLDNGTLLGTVTATQQNSASTNVNVGRRAGGGFNFIGRIDDVRIADHALTADQIQTDMLTPLAGAAPGPDTVAPVVALTAPTTPTVAGTVTVSATASDNVGVLGVQFLLDNVALGTEDTTSPYSVSWNTTTASNGSHTLAARARDAAGNATTTTLLTVTVDNQAPTGTVTINNGAAATNSTSATLTLSASDALTGVTQMRFSNNGTTYSTAEAYATTKVWTLATGAGTKTVYVQFKDAAGNWSAAVTDTIVLDTTGPTITARTATALTANGATVTWTTNEAATSQVDYGLTTSYGSTTTIDPSLITSHSVVLSGLAPNTTYNFRVRSTDAAGNTTTSANSTFKTAAAPADPNPPQVFIDGPASGTQVSNIVNVTADAIDNTGVAGVRFYVDGVAVGVEDTTDPYALAWDTRTVANGAHTLTAVARDLDGNTTTSAPITVNVANSSGFTNQVLATGFNLPTAIKFLPDGRLLLVELGGTIRVLSAPYTQVDPTPFLQLTNVGEDGVQQGIYDIALDPNFTTNHYYYISYTAGTPNRDRLSRFTANATLTGTIANSEFIIYEDPQNANAEHHGGAINFGNDGKIYYTTGEHFDSSAAQDLRSPRGKILRFNADGTIPTDNPFYDGTGPNYDAIWARGLRNPYRAYYDAPTDRLIIGDVGGNVYSTAIEEVNIGARGANYGWPNVEAPNGNTSYTAPAYYYAHNGRDAAITGGFVYHGSQFPSSYQGSYFFADYTQNWIKRLTFNADGSVSGVFNFEPANGTVDGPYGDIVYLTEGPDGSLFYLDLGYSDISGTFGVSKLRRISYTSSDLPPVVQASANPTEGATPLSVTFSSAGSSDPEGRPLTYSWNFGDGTTSTEANPTHVYSVAGPYQARLTVSDGVSSSLSTPLTISAGNKPVVTVQTSSDGILFKAGDVITFSGTATDTEDGTLPASAYTWNIDFLHEGHVHPGTPITGVTGGSFTIPTSGHDFSGNTRYRVSLTVTDSNGLQTTTFVIVYPQKVNLTFDAIPTGVTLYLDGIAHAAPFVYDTLVGFNHTIEARNAVVGSNTYTFASWSDGGAQTHVITVPADRADLFSDLHRHQHAGSARLRAGRRRHAPDQPDHGRGDVRECTGGGRYQHPGHRLEQHHLQHHVRHRLGRQRLSAGRADRARLRHQPGHLLRQQHQGGSRRYQHRDGDLQRRDRVCRHPRDGVQRSRSGQPVRRGRIRIGLQCIGEHRCGHHHRAPRADLRSRNNHRPLHRGGHGLHQPHHHLARRRHR